MHRFLKIFAAFLLLSLGTSVAWVPKDAPRQLVPIVCICIAIGATIL